MIIKPKSLKFKFLIYGFLILELLSWGYINSRTNNLYIDIGFAMGIFLTISMHNVAVRHNTTVKCDLCEKVIKDNEVTVHIDKKQKHYDCYKKELI